MHPGEMWPYTFASISALNKQTMERYYSRGCYESDVITAEESITSKYTFTTWCGSLETNAPGAKLVLDFVLPVTQAAGYDFIIHTNILNSTALDIVLYQQLVSYSCKLHYVTRSLRFAMETWPTNSKLTVTVHDYSALTLEFNPLQKRLCFLYIYWELYTRCKVVNRSPITAICCITTGEFS